MQIIKERDFSDAIINSLPGVFYLQDHTTGKFLRWNKEFERVSGYNTDEISELPKLVFFEEEEKPNIIKKIEEAFTHGSADVESTIVTRNGERIPYYLTVQSIQYEGRSCLVGIGIDITERKKTQEQIIKEKDLSESIINSLPGIFYLQEITGEFLRWNKKFETVTGYTAEEITKLHPLDFFNEDDKEIILKKSMEIYTDGAADLEATVITKEGNKVPHYFTGQLIEYEGRPCIIGTGIDIAERKKASEQLLKEKELSESIINSLPGIFYLFDNTGKYLRWNKNHETVPGYSAEEMQNMHPLNFFDEDEKALIKERIEKVFKEGYADAEANFMSKDGKKTPYYFNGIAIEYEGKSCLMGVAFDITERKVMERELREAEQKFRDLVEKSLVGVYIITGTKFDYVNPRFAGIFGYSQEELINKVPLDIIVHEDEKARVAKNIRDRLTGEKDSIHYEAIGKKKNGELMNAEVYGSRTIYRGKPAIIGSLIDVTERKKAEEALQKSEANLHTIFDTTDTIYVLLDNNFQVMSFNQRAFEFFEKELHQPLRLYTNLINYFPEDRHQEVYKRIKTVMTGEHVNYESSYPQTDDSINWYYVRMFPIRNREGKIFGMMVAVSDITEKKLLEQEILTQKVQEQKKMTRAVLNAQEKERNKIGQELHDNVNQILVGAKMYLGLTKKGKAKNEKLIKKSISLIDDAINEIRSLTRDQVTPQKKIDLKDLIQSQVDNLNEHSLFKTNFVYDIDGFVITDDLKLNIYRIIQEGINNILKHAAAKNATLLVKAGNKGLHILITDDGKGFDFAAKVKGVGIANILSRVESYNGIIAIDSRPGKGCKIDLTIPL